jgi:hypothetical protein
MAEIIDFKSRLSKTTIQEHKLDSEVEVITDAILSSSLESLIRLGYNLEENFNEILPSIILLKEAITSLQLNLRKEEHFLQDYAKNVFTITDENS